MSVYIIAEVGVNHNGSVDVAKRLVREAKAAGCNCVKFQMFSADKIVVKTAQKADYQIQNTGNDDTQYNMLKKLELTVDDFREIKYYCQLQGIDFMATPFDEEAVGILEEFGVNVYKISSGDITNKPLLQCVASKKKPILLSTGMSTLEEVRNAVNWINEVGKVDVILLHCTSNYPADYSTVNMRAMLTLKDEFHCMVGYSDHTEGIEIPIMAVAMGATVIEKHFTYDRNAEGPDHVASLEPNELKKMVDSIRHIEMAMGDGEKKPTREEFHIRKVARKSLVWNCDMKKGIVVKKEDVCCKRPGTGISPSQIEDIIGKKVCRECYEDDLIEYEDICSE